MLLDNGRFHASRDARRRAQLTHGQRNRRSFDVHACLGADRGRERRRHRVPDLLVLLAEMHAVEHERVGEPLEACRFAQGDRTVLRVHVRAPMRIAFGQDRRRELGPLEPAERLV
jgi:hypothetical protein